MEGRFNPGMKSSKTAEWYTPDKVFAEIDLLYGPFTLDPCATPESARAGKFYTKDDDGLAHSWDGKTVFMNPPYGRGIDKWIEKAATSKAYTVCLIPARTETRWWQKWIGGRYPWKATDVWFWNGRIQFFPSKTNAPFPSAVVVFDNRNGVDSK